MEVEIPDHVAVNRVEPDSGRVETSFRAEIDTSAPFESVKEAVTRFGGLGYWKPTPNLNNNNRNILAEHQNEELDPEKLEEQAAIMEKELIVKERETLEVLKELESTKRLVENLKSKLQKEEECEAQLKLTMSVCDNNNISSVTDVEEDKENLASHALTDIEEDKENLASHALPHSNESSVPHSSSPQGSIYVEEDKENLASHALTDIEEDKENLASHALPHSNESSVPHSSSPQGSILMELKQAKLNLNRTTNDIADVRVSVEMLNKKLEKERISLEKTRERLSQNSSKISSLEEELNQTRLKLQVAKDAEIKGSLDDPSDITRELQRLSSEADHFKKMGEAARSEVLRAMSEIEQTKSMIQTAEIRLIAARKMKEAAMAAEAAALAEIKALSHQESSAGDCMKNHDGVTLSFEEYTALTCKARDAEEHSKKRIVDAMLQVDEANLSKMDILKRVEEATEEVKTSKKALEEALERVEAANKGKLAVEEALRKWRSEGQKRRSSIHNGTKFKTSYPSYHRRDSRLFDVNGLNLSNDEASPVLKPTLSIGQILSRKLMMPDEFESRTLRERSSAKRKVSLGQMLGRQSLDQEVEKENGHQQFSAKRKKFGFARFSLLLTKQQKKKKPTLNLR